MFQCETEEPTIEANADEQLTTKIQKEPVKGELDDCDVRLAGEGHRQKRQGETAKRRYVSADA